MVQAGGTSPAEACQGKDTQREGVSRTIVHRAMGGRKWV